jgi:hypothetical protein
MRSRSVANVAIEAAKVAVVMAAVRRSAVAGEAAKAVRFRAVARLSVPFRARCPAAPSVH